MTVKVSIQKAKGCNVYMNVNNVGIFYRTRKSLENGSTPFFKYIIARNISKFIFVSLISD